MRPRNLTIDEVASRRRCTECGAGAVVEPGWSAPAIGTRCGVGSAARCS